MSDGRKQHILENTDFRIHSPLHGCVSLEEDKTNVSSSRSRELTRERSVILDRRIHGDQWGSLCFSIGQRACFAEKSFGPFTVFIPQSAQHPRADQQRGDHAETARVSRTRWSPHINPDGMKILILSIIILIIFHRFHTYYD